MRRRRGSALALMTVVVGVVLAGCSEARVSSADDMCVQYSELVDKVDSLSSIDPETATVDELRDQADQVEEQLDALQATAEGRLDTLISTLRASVDDLRSTVSDAGQDVLDTARPLIEDTLDDVREAWATLEQVADVRCGEA